MEYSKLDKRILLSWRIVRIISLIIVGTVLITAVILLSRTDYFAPYSHYSYILVSCILVYMLVTLIVFPAIEYRQWGYIISDDRIEIRHGIFYIKNIVIPIIRVQHITVSQGPINRKLGISTVRIHTASGQFSIEGISDEYAALIAETLKAKLYNRLDAQNK